MCEHDYMNNFGRLGELSNGDIIEIKTNYGDFFYQKYDEQVVLETETGKLPIQDSEEILMLYTCYNPEKVEHTPYIFVIYAKKIQKINKKPCIYLSEVDTWFYFFEKKIKKLTYFRKNQKFYDIIVEKILLGDEQID